MRLSEQMMHLHGTPPTQPPNSKLVKSRRESHMHSLLDHRGCGLDHYVAIHDANNCICTCLMWSQYLRDATVLNAFRHCYFRHCSFTTACCRSCQAACCNMCPLSSCSSTSSRKRLAVVLHDKDCAAKQAERLQKNQIGRSELSVFDLQLGPVSQPLHPRSIPNCELPRSHDTTFLPVEVADERRVAERCSCRVCCAE